MTKPIERGTHARSCDVCGFSRTYATPGLADFGFAKHSCERWLAKAATTARGDARMAAIDRTPKACKHPRAAHQHGTYAAYTLDRCRCLPCAFASSQYDQDLTRAKAYGTYDTWIDPEPARQHVRALMAQGMGLKRIIALGGSNSGQLWKLLYGTKRADGQRIPTKRIRRDVAERLLALELDLADGAYVPALPSTRRVRALVALGWSQNRLADHLGWSLSVLNTIAIGARPQVFVRTARAIADLYDELSMTPPPETTKGERVGASRARRHAKARGWTPPLGIDEELLDDEFEGGQIVVDLDPGDVDHVAVDRRLAGDQSVRLNKAERRELVRSAHAAGISDNEAERRTGYTSKTFYRIRHELGLAIAEVA